MKLIKKDIAEITENPYNPRYIRYSKFKELVNSIKKFPQMLEVRPIVVDTNMVVLGGNMRLKALKKAGIKKIPIQVVEWDENKKKEFIIKDNIAFGGWDWDILANEWEVKELKEWGLEILRDEDINLDDFFEDKEEEIDKKNKIILEYNEIEYNKIIDKLNSIKGSKEKIIYDLLFK